MVDVVGRDIWSGSQRNHGAVGERPGRRTLCARERAEIIVERTVLFDDEDDVLDFVHPSLTFVTVPAIVLTASRVLLPENKLTRHTCCDRQADGNRASKYSSS